MLVEPNLANVVPVLAKHGGGLVRHCPVSPMWCEGWHVLSVRFQRTSGSSSRRPQPLASSFLWDRSVILSDMAEVVCRSKGCCRTHECELSIPFLVALVLGRAVFSLLVVGMRTTEKNIIQSRTVSRGSTRALRLFALYVATNTQQPRRNQPRFTTTTIPTFGSLAQAAPR